MRISASIVVALSCALLPLPLTAQSRITTPLQEFGHNIGDDYFLANYAQLARYWTKLDRESNRMKVVRIGTSVEGRPMLMSIITSPQNHANLGRYQEIAARLARAEGLTDAQARALAREGKAVVWIDGGLHASEVLGAQQLVQFVYEMASRNDAETQRFLRDVILLAVPANPDGMDLVSNWYMREPVPTKRSTSGLPVLYHKYIGHDNNRDSYMASQPETQAMDSIMFRAWYPQIMYNHHQTGPAGTVMFAPPFRDPFNYNFDPLIPVGIDLVGAAIHGRFIAEGKPGSTMRTGANYSTWWNGGLRTTAYFHNIIGLLTETIGNPTPMTVAFRPERLLPSGNLPYPILPQTWRFAQSMAYELSANRAVMDVASKHREDLLYNIYKMGRNSIERGSRDNWTLTPDRVEAVKLAVARDSAAKVPATPAQYISSVLYARAARDPRGYIIPSDQADFPTVVKFVNALVKNGITIHRATRPFTAGGRGYSAGSYVVKTAQAFRPHILDMFEPQDHPDDILYPGAPPTPPYDNAGWTLAYQMGVRFDRILDAFDGPFERLVGFASVPTPAVAAGPPWYAISRRSNDAFTAVNRLLARGEEVYSTPAALKTSGRVLDAGTFLIRAKPSTVPIAREIASSTGIAFEPVLGVASESGLTQLRLPRIAIYDRYGGSMESGWLRFVLEKFAFPYEVVFPPTIDAGNLNAKYDVLILMDSASVPHASHARNEEREPSYAPAEWRARQGGMTIAKTLPQIQSFVSSGGTLLAIGEAADVAYLLQLPVASAVSDNDGKPLPRSQYYVPGSILSVAVDTSSAISWGMRPRADVFFDKNPVFRLLPEARTRGIRRVAWFDTAAPLRSGWAWGQKALEGASAVIVAPIEKGHAILYGPEIYFRSQSHGTFPFLFNGIYYSQSAPR